MSIQFIRVDGICVNSAMVVSGLSMIYVSRDETANLVAVEPGLEDCHGSWCSLFDRGTDLSASSGLKEVSLEGSIS